MRDYPSMPDPQLGAARPLLASSEGLLGLAANGSSSSIPSMHRHSTNPPLLPIKESPLAPRLEPRPKLDLGLPSLPQKTRKRHKVATSCNRCRQNKRKCDSGIPCSNCRRNKADCLYTDAQLSRSTWGDSPLSREKIVGVTTADILEMDTTPTSSTNGTVSGSTTQTISKPPTTPTKPSPSSKKATVFRKGSFVAAAVSSNVFTSSAQASALSSTPAVALFSPGHASSSEKDSAIDRRKEVVAAQTRQIAKALRIAKPGPQQSFSDIITQGNTSSALSIQSTIKQHNSYAFRGLESHSLAATQGTAADYSGSSFATSPAQPPSTGTLQHTSGLRQPLSSLPHQTQHSLQTPQTRQGCLDELTVSPTQYSTPPEPDRQRLPLGGTSEGYTRLSSLIPSQGDLNVIAHGYQNGATTVFSGGENRMALHQSTGPQIPISGHENSPVHSQGQQNGRYPIQQQQQQQHVISSGSGIGVPSQLQQQQYHQQATMGSGNVTDPNHSISSAAPTSSFVVPSQFSLQAAWGTTHSPQRLNGQLGWRGSNEPPVTVTAVTPAPTTASAPSAEEQMYNLRMRRIAKGILDWKTYDYSIMLPRHISQEYGELWVNPQSVTSTLHGIPRQFLMLPKDANYLADVFFEHAYFYYPIINRSVVELHLMEPHTPQALFLLNVVFMGACKHLGRATDIKRAIQFRERAREIQHFVDAKERITKMQATLLGSQVIYGVFVPVIGLSQVCGTYKALPTADPAAADENEPMVDLAAESRSLMSNKGLIPEAVYQQRLWTFWGLYTRDAMGRLYFGWPHGMDNLIVDAELPMVKGCVGLGGMRKGLTGHNGLDAATTGKRRGTAITTKQTQREKKLLKAEAAAKQSGRDKYRVASSPATDDEDDDESNDADDQEDESDLEQDEITPNNMSSQNRGTIENTGRFKATSAVPTEGSVPSSQQHSQDNTPGFSGLSRQLLERQSRGEDVTRRQGTPGSSINSAQVRRHLDRMKVLLAAEDDITDGGSYARLLFLEEVKLWSIGRRVGLYLQGRNTSLSMSPAAPATGSFSLFDKPSVGNKDPFGSSYITSTAEAARCSESAWLEDKELQQLQSELIAWEEALPPLFKFRQDLEQPDINHKVNGRLSVLKMYYYTITIMLQSSYLPIPQYLSSTSRSSATKSPESISQEYDDLFSRATSMAFSDEGSSSSSRIKSEEYFHTGRSPQSFSDGYFNTAHRICTQLSNVLYHHVELMLDSYPNWCSIQAKLNQSLTAALRVSCLNARLNSNSKAIRDEAKAGFKMGSELFKRQAILPAPLTVRDWPAEEDVKQMLDLEEEFRELMTTQEEEQTLVDEEVQSQSQTRDDDGFGMGPHEGGDPGDHLLYTPELHDDHQHGLPPFETTIASQYDIFGLNAEGFQFNYSMDA